MKNIQCSTHTWVTFFVCIGNVSFLTTSVQYIPDIHSGGKLDSSVISIMDFKYIFVVVVEFHSVNFIAGYWC